MSITQGNLEGPIFIPAVSACVRLILDLGCCLSPWPPHGPHDYLCTLARTEYRCYMYMVGHATVLAFLCLGPQDYGCKHGQRYGTHSKRSQWPPCWRIGSAQMSRSLLCYAQCVLYPNVRPHSRSLTITPPCPTSHTLYYIREDRLPWTWDGKLDQRQKDVKDKEGIE